MNEGVMRKMTGVSALVLVGRGLGRLAVPDTMMRAPFIRLARAPRLSKQSCLVVPVCSHRSVRRR
jgi:hypothetical protein